MSHKDVSYVQGPFGIWPSIKTPTFHIGVLVQVLARTRICGEFAPRHV